MVFVHLPAQESLADAPRSRRPPISAADSVHAIVRRLGLPLLDLRDTLRRYGPSDSLIAHADAHLTVRGNRVVAEIVLRYLTTFDSLPVPGTAGHRPPRTAH